MSLKLTGVVNSARPLASKDNSFHFYAMDIITSRGDRAVCQVFDNHPLYQTLVDQGETYVNHKVNVGVLSYSTASRELKSGATERFIRYRIGSLEDLGPVTDDNTLTGVVTNAKLIVDPDGEYEFLALEIGTSRGTTYSCQMWGDDPQFSSLADKTDGLIDHKVQVAVKKFGIRDRKMKDNSTQMQATFHVTALQNLGLAD